MELEKENVVQAVVIMDTFNHNFSPINKSKPLGLFTVAGVPLLDYSLESLALGGVGETILFCCQDGATIKEHIKKKIESKSPWSMSMEVQILTSDTCQTMGDVMREIDAAGLVRGYFVLLGVNSITNINFASMLEQHKQTCKRDKGAAMTLIYKKVAWEHPLISCDKPTFVAADAYNRKVLIHQKFKPKSNDKTLSLPLESVLCHSEVKLHHNLADANIALCSPSVPPLFSDNFDFQTRDDFIHGILINEEILASSLYYTLLKDNQYAAAVTNWKTYQTVCRDILHNWAYPLTIETGSFYKDNYVLIGYHNFRNKTSTLSRSCTLTEDVLVGENTHIKDHTTISKSIIGNNCNIGNDVTISGSQIMNNVVIKDNCKIVNSFLDDNCVIEENSILEGGVIMALGVNVKAGSHLNGNIIESSENKENEKPLTKSTSESGTEWENESSGSAGDEFIGFEKTWTDSDSNYSSDSSDDSSLPDSPIPEDTNSNPTRRQPQRIVSLPDLQAHWSRRVNSDQIAFMSVHCGVNLPWEDLLHPQKEGHVFLQEVIDSLERGYKEKLKCDYLILEINSSRYAYNIQLHEVNFFVVRALLSMPVLAETNNVLGTVKDIFKYFKPIVSNYIKTKSSSMDCLRAIEDSCLKCEWLAGKTGQIVHFLYEADVVDEDSLLEWQEDLIENESPVLKEATLVKFFEWLQQASEESEESD